MGEDNMAANKTILSPAQKRKLLLVLRLLLLTAAVFYLLFLFYNNFSADNKLAVYFSTKDANYLRLEEREIDQDKDLYLQIFEELKAGPESSELGGTIPDGSQLLEYEIEGELIVLNFNRALKDNHWGGSAGELLTVYSIVNSYTALDQIQKVRILIEGEEVESLVGHLDLSQPLMYNQKLTEGS